MSNLVIGIFKDESQRKRRRRLLTKSAWRPWASRTRWS